MIQMKVIIRKVEFRRQISDKGTTIDLSANKSGIEKSKKLRKFTKTLLLYVTKLLRFFPLIISVISIKTFCENEPNFPNLC